MDKVHDHSNLDICTWNWRPKTVHGLFGYVLDFQSDSFLFRLQMQFDIMTQDFAYSNLVPIFMKKNVVEFKTGRIQSLCPNLRWNILTDVMSDMMMWCNYRHHGAKKYWIYYFLCHYNFTIFLWSQLSVFKCRKDLEYILWSRIYKCYLKYFLSPLCAGTWCWYAVTQQFQKICIQQMTMSDANYSLRMTVDFILFKYKWQCQEPLF